MVDDDRALAAEDALFKKFGGGVMNTFVNEYHMRFYVETILKAADAFSKESE